MITFRLNSSFHEQAGGHILELMTPAENSNPPETGEKAEKKPLPPVLLKVLDFLFHSGKAIQNGVFRFQKLLTEPGSIWLEFPFLLKAVRSKDLPSRRMAWVFILSSCTLVFVLVYLSGKHFHDQSILKAQLAQLEKARMEELTRDEKEIERQRQGVAILGKFIVQLTGDVAFQPKGGPNPLNLAEVEVIAYCDSPETQSFVNTHLVAVRNVVSSVFTPVNRSELMSRDGKLRLTQMILKRLNDWLPRGKVEKVFLSRVAIG